MGFMYMNGLEGRYGGRAESGTKKSLNQGILAIFSRARTDRYRYSIQVPGPADEAICFG